MDIPTSLKAIIFDFDGTLFNLDIDWDIVRQKLHSLGVERIDTIDSLEAAKQQAALSILGEAEMLGIKYGGVAAHAKEVLETLSTHYKLAIVSRNLRATLAAGLNKIGFEDNIVVVARDDVSALKPDPQGFDEAMKRMGVERAQSLIVGDTTHDVVAAKALGIPSIVVANASLDYQPLDADYYINNLSELLGLINSIEKERMNNG